MDLVLYIHGKGGNADECARYGPLFPGCAVRGLDYRISVPWETGEEIRAAVVGLKSAYDHIYLIANSIGAFHSMNAGIDRFIGRAWFISPIVDMERLIRDMMGRAGVTEDELRARGVIPTDFGEDLSWAYYTYVRTHPLRWDVPTEILCGSRDDLTSAETVSDFAKRHGARLNVMENGEHWFHTEEQLRYLDEWIRGTRNDPAR